ncbi:MAG: NADAR family protein [bacterium]|nr:NADAR family protein [bacterium]MDD2941828.1 NADAR family protein [bacterium]
MKTYIQDQVVSFCKTREAFGGLSNMAAGYLITLYGIRCKTSEHLYQALKFPNHPEIQAEILAKPSPIAAKMVAKRCRHLIRPDWEEIKLPVMAYCLRAKLQCNFQRFGSLLLSTGDADIVEISSKNDTFWGCIPQDDLLVGHNHLGIQLTNLCDELVNDEDGIHISLRDELVNDEDGIHIAMLAPPDGVELRLMGRVLGPLEFYIPGVKEIEDPLAVIRARRVKKQLNSTNGGF